MPRLIITYPTLHQVLSAEKALRSATQEGFKFRPTPTPPGLSADICGMSIEILDFTQKSQVLAHLQAIQLHPKGVHELP